MGKRHKSLLEKIQKTREIAEDTEKLLKDAINEFKDAIFKK